MREELKQLVEDIKKMQEAQVLLARVTTTKIEPEINKLIEYAIKHKIINTTRDVVDICFSVPELKDIITRCYDEHIENIINKANQRYKDAQYMYDNRYAGTYNSLSEVPGYGTEWNSRCIPSGVVIKNKGRNSRC